MKAFAAALSAAAATATTMSQMDYDFMRYVSMHNKVYETVEEFNTRQVNFAETDAHVRSVNENPLSTHKAAHNKFSDWSQEEFEGMLGLKNVTLPEVMDVNVGEEEVSLNLPTSWDWRSEGMVTPVKDQGSCGSCWAFSATEAIESAWMIAGNDEAIMAPQELVDCTLDPVTQSDGCSGGWYFWAYDWLKTNKMMLEADYPYTSGKTGTETACAYNESEGVTEVSSYGRTAGKAQNLSRLQQQPVNVAVAAGNNTFRNYSSGVVTATDGCPTAIDHAIVAVGWGVDNGVEYYIVRNSWGTGWGLDGYIHIATDGGLKGVCGINQYVYYPTV